VLFSHLYLALPSGLLISGFAIIPLYATQLSSSCAVCLAHLFLTDWITLVIFAEQKSTPYILSFSIWILYNPNIKFILIHRLGSWTQAVISPWVLTKVFLFPLWQNLLHKYRFRVHKNWSEIALKFLAVDSRLLLARKQYFVLVYMLVESKNICGKIRISSCNCSYFFLSDTDLNIHWTYTVIFLLFKILGTQLYLKIEGVS